MGNGISFPEPKILCVWCMHMNNGMSLTFELNVGYAEVPVHFRAGASGRCSGSAGSSFWIGT